MGELCPVTALALALALAVPQGPQGAPPGRIWTSPTLHVGVRPALYLDNEKNGGRLELGVGCTVQVSTTVIP
jgi:hypothetical protein